jgi:DNA-binding GntR family transcriptional regulator
VISTKLTPDDMLLIEELRNERVVHMARGKLRREQMHYEFLMAKRLTDQKIAEKFGVSRTHISRLFANARD